MAELNKLGKLDQMEIMEAIGAVSPQRLHEPSGDLGRFERAGRPIYRLRVEDWRVYFSPEGDGVRVDFLLHKKSIADFVVRFKLPVADDAEIERHKSFGEYLDSLMK